MEKTNTNNYICCGIDEQLGLPKLCHLIDIIAAEVETAKKTQHNEKPKAPDILEGMDASSPSPSLVVHTTISTADINRQVQMAATSVEGELFFEPMAPDDLHMTMCFLGDLLRHAKRPVLETLVGQLHATSTPCSGGGGSTDSVSGSSSSPTTLAGVPLKVELFPPGKQNLLVLMVKMPKAVVSRQQSLVDICEDVLLQNKGSSSAATSSHSGVKAKKNGGDRSAQSIVRAKNHAEWVPHITLGKLYGDSSKFHSVAQAINSQLATTTTRGGALSSFSSLEFSGFFTLGGSLPPQSYGLEWGEVPL